jgi:hypothetical protein
VPDQALWFFFKILKNRLYTIAPHLAGGATVFLPEASGEMCSGTEA